MMTSSFVQCKPIGLSLGKPQMGMAPKNNTPCTLGRQGFLRARSLVSRPLFGKPQPGEIHAQCRRHEIQQFENFKNRYELLSGPIETTASIDSESRLEESLIDKELREYEMKLSHVSCDETLVADRVRSRNLKQLKSELALADTSAKCSSSGERPKPYTRQQSSITDYYSQRKMVVCHNNSRTFDAQSTEEADEVLPLPIEDNVEIEATTNSNSASAVTVNEPSSSSTHQCDQEQVSLHTKATDSGTELA